MGGGGGVRVAVIGAGILGAAVARELLLRDPAARVTVIEKEAEPALHQTGRNSGVVHAGLYYPPGSAKARLVRSGIDLLRTFCADRDLPYQECGKVLVALTEQDRERMTAIFDRARANGVPGVRLVDADGLREIEPHADRDRRAALPDDRDHRLRRDHPRPAWTTCPRRRRRCGPRLAVTAFAEVPGGVRWLASGRRRRTGRRRPGDPLRRACRRTGGAARPGRAGAA